MPVANLAPGCAEFFNLANGERREIVMEHIALCNFALQSFNMLLIVLCAERASHKCLRLAALENRGAV